MSYIYIIYMVTGTNIIAQEKSSNSTQKRRLLLLISLHTVEIQL